MIYQEMELTLKVKWLDPETVDKAKRRALVADRLVHLFKHQFGETAVDYHGVGIEVTAIDGVGIGEDREVKDTSEVSSSDNIPSPEPT